MAIVIPAYNEEKNISSCLKSIINSVNKLNNYGLVEIIVVDNGSEDKTISIINSFKHLFKYLYLVKEKRRGPGWARAAGVSFALDRKYFRTQSKWDDFWLISTDADVLVPEDWIKNWVYEINNSDELIITGSSIFDNDFNFIYPNASKLLSILKDKVDIAEKIFGVINTEGFNCAIEYSAYLKVGPFIQPTQLILGNKKVNLAGEDWDMGMRARFFDMKVKRSKFDPVISSSRRFRISPREFFNGMAYDKPFEKIKEEDLFLDKDIEVDDFRDYYLMATYRWCLYYVEKPILIDKHLLDREKNVSRILGKSVVKDIVRWIEINRIPDIFTQRNIFIFEYLPAFHKIFGRIIREKVFGNNYFK